MKGYLILPHLKSISLLYRLLWLGLDAHNALLRRYKLNIHSCEPDCGLDLHYSSPSMYTIGNDATLALSYKPSPSRRVIGWKVATFFSDWLWSTSLEAPLLSTWGGEEGSHVDTGVVFLFSLQPAFIVYFTQEWVVKVRLRLLKVFLLRICCVVSSCEEDFILSRFINNAGMHQTVGMIL